MIDIENLQIAVQTRADALTGTPTDEQVLEVGIAARSVELAGGLIDRSVLNTAIQAVIDGASGSTANADLIALGATLPRAVAGAGSIDVGTYVTGLFKGNPKYLQCNSSTYLRSAYPELSDLMLSSLSQQISISASENTNISSLVGYEKQSTVYKVGSKYYKLSGGSASPSGWQTIPIQSSLDGISYLPVAAPSIASPISTHSASCQLDTLVAVGTTLVAFGRMTAGGSNYLIQLRSLDEGRTWIFSSLTNTAQSHSSLYGAVLAAVIGSTVIIHARGDASSSVRYTTNLGGSWASITDVDVINSKYINGLIQDGTRFIVGFTDGSSAYSATSNPSGNTWTAVAPPSPNAKGVLGVVGSKWIMAGDLGYVATCTVPGTWVAQTTCTSSMPTFYIERIQVNGVVIAFSSIPVVSQVFYCTDASTLPAVTAVVADSVVGSPGRLSLASVSDNYFYLRQESNSLIRSGSLVPGSFTPVQVDLDTGAVGEIDSVTYSTLKKFGLYFCSVGGVGQNLRYVSLDMKNWFTAPANISVGCGAVVDAGTRLLALDGNQLLWQSTDGVTWNTTGITRPTLSSTPYSAFARLFVCTNGWIYYVAFRGSDSSYYIYVSKNDGATWASVGGVSMAGSSGYTNILQNPCLFKEINGKIYSLSVNYFSSAYGYYLHRSTDGITFNNITGIANGLANVSYNRRNGICEVDGVIYVFVGADINQWLASYDDGMNFSVIPESFVPTNLLPLVNLTSWMVVNNVSNDGAVYLRTSTPETFVQLADVSFDKSSNYEVDAARKSPIFLYESEVLKMLTTSRLGASKLLSLADTNATFTLPTIINTWLRASS